MITFFYITCQQIFIDIIRQTIIAVAIPITSAIKAAYKTNLVFFILTTPVYTAIVYNVVSVAPIITDAIIPISLSTP